MPKQEYIGLLIGAARRGIRQAVAAALRGRGVSTRQFWILVRIHAEPGMSVRELAARQRLDEPAASRVVADLIRRKWLRADPDPNDRRRLRLRLTPAGERLGTELRAIAGTVREAVVAGMSPGELEALRGGLRRVIENMARFAERSDPAREPTPRGKPARPRRRAKKPARGAG